jgi:hypothetical protein
MSHMSASYSKTISPSILQKLLNLGSSYESLLI